VRARMSAFTSGSAVVTVKRSAVTIPFAIIQ
jgi:hypothetical protein